MITVLLAGNQEKVKELLSEMLLKDGNVDFYISKQANVVKIISKDEFRQLTSIRDKIIELEEYLYRENKGKLYKCVLESIEKPLFEKVLKRTEGNQFKAAKILGLNRNTLKSKMKKLDIKVNKWKI